MTDQTGAAPMPEAPSPPPAATAHPPFPIGRFFLAIGFGIAAWLVFWLIVALAVLQFLLALIQALVSGTPTHAADEIKHFSRNLVQYLAELMSFIAFVRDEKPFPFAPFPKT